MSCSPIEAQVRMVRSECTVSAVLRWAPRVEGGWFWTEQVYPDKQELLALVGNTQQWGCHASGGIRQWFEQNGWTFADVPEMPPYVETLLGCTELWFDASLHLESDELEPARQILVELEHRSQSCASQPALAAAIAEYSDHLREAIRAEERGD